MSCSADYGERKRYINLNGISFTLAGDTDRAMGVRPLAQKMMHMMKMQNVNDLDHVWNTHRMEDGTVIRVESRFGRDSAYVYCTPYGGVEKRRGRKIRKVLYVPAFHACTIDGVIRGLVLCVSGRWGKPYVFFPCTSSDIYTFSYGQWNTEREYTRVPPPVGAYEEEKFLGMSISYNGNPAQIFEIPASHSYMGDDYSPEKSYEDKRVWTPWETVAGYDHCHKETVGVGDTIYHEESSVRIITDWDNAFWPTYEEVNSMPPATSIEALDFYQWEDIWQLRAYDSRWLAPDSSDCDPVNHPDYGNLWVKESKGNCDCYHGKEFTCGYAEWCTFDGIGLNDGAFFVGVSNRNDGVYEHELSATYEGGGELLSRIPFDNGTVEDYFYAFGNAYKLYESGGPVGYNVREDSGYPPYWIWENHLGLAAPRIYRTKDGFNIALGWAARAGVTNSNEFICINTGQGIVQYNDDSAKFPSESLSSSRYFVDIGFSATIDGEEQALYCFKDKNSYYVKPRANFSLIKMVWEEEVKE